MAASAIKATIARIGALSRAAASTFGSVGYDSEADLVAALANSYGTATIPARGFIQIGMSKVRSSSAVGEITLDTPIAKIVETVSNAYRDAIAEAANTAGSWAAPHAAATRDEGQLLGGRLADLQSEVVTSG